MKKRIIALAMAAAAFLSGCKTDPMPDATVKEDVEPTAVYDWMAGESPVPNERIGVVRAGFQGVMVAVSPTGVYFIPEIHNFDAQRFIMYVDHGSDQVIKLCGRADCTHDDADCNACIYEPQQLSFFDGYLYVKGKRETSIGTTFETEPKSSLWRVDPDGSNWVEAFDHTAFGEELLGSDGRIDLAIEMISDGYALWSVSKRNETIDGQLDVQKSGYYLYPLDGSEDPRQSETNGWALYQCGDVLLTLRGETQHGGENGSYWDWDWEMDTITYLTDHPGVPGWFGKEQGYYFRDGAICRLTYATQEEEVMVDTGLEGKYYAFCLPDCIILASREETDVNLYFYNWAFQLVDTVPLDFPHTERTEFLVLEETAERVILTDDIVYGWPKYYIEKSELGTGEAKVRHYDLSAVAEVDQEWQEEEEWFENG